MWSPQCQSMIIQESNLSILRLSPLKYPLKDGDQYGILGYPAMTKLNLAVHLRGNNIF